MSQSAKDKLRTQTDQNSAEERFKEVCRQEQIARNQAAIAVFNSFLDGDEDEQTATWEIVKKALDENRPEGSKLYP